MAAKPKAAPAKKTTNTAVGMAKVALPANYQEQVEADIAKFKSRMAASTANAIKNQQDKSFLIPGAEGEDNVEVSEFVGIIVDFCAHKAWYEFPYVEGEQSPANCFALGFNPHNSLIPSDNSPDKQCDDCASCEKNQFTQNATGKWLPKDCGDKYVLAVADDTGRLLKVSLSSTAIKAFDSYVNKLAGQGQAPYHVLTEFTFDPGSKYPSVRCAKVKDIPQDGMGAVLSLRDAAMEMVSQEPLTDGFEEKVVAKRIAVSKPKGKAGARKAA